MLWWEVLWAGAGTGEMSDQDGPQEQAKCLENRNAHIILSAHLRYFIISLLH